jgi:AcrR family transcriptional regulator
MTAVILWAKLEWRLFTTGKPRLEHAAHGHATTRHPHLARLLALARERVATTGYQGLRIDELVQAAGVAKGTFFTHFADKDALMDCLIGERLEDCLGALRAVAAPRSPAELAQRLQALLELMGSERYVFDLVIRRSGAAASDEIGPVAEALGRLGQLLLQWLPQAGRRADVAPELLAEGVEALRCSRWR